jgi:hypothetical protein
MAFKNKGKSPELLSCELLTIRESLSYGITSVISSKEKGTLRTFPVWSRVILIPFATPRFSAGTEPMIELVLGGINKALPAPNSSRLINTAPYEDFSVNVENHISAAALETKPTVLSTRLPYLSASLPLIGLMKKITISMGMSKTPVFKAL